MAYVYRHIRLDKNEPFYIGIGSDKTYKRAYSKRSRNIIWKSIINRSDFNVEILIDDLTWEEACEKEKEFISLYGRIDNKTGTLANLTNGGDGSLGLIQGEEARKKKSIASKGRIVSNETRLKISQSKTGKKRHYDVNKKVSEGLKKYYETNKPWSYGKEMPQKTKLKISIAKTGCIGPNLGKKMNLESKKKLSDYNKYVFNASAKIVVDVSTGVFFNSIPQAAEAYNIHPSTLYKQLLNKRKNKTNLRLA